MEKKRDFTFASGYLRSLKKTREFPYTKTLGVLWVVHKDKGSFSFVPPLEELVLTKANVLKKTAAVHDPFVVLAKMLMQEAWMEAMGWDEELLYHLKVKWKDGSN